VWENVKGTFSSNDGADFWAIIQAFTDIGGYRLEWQLLNTSWFLPQNRERIYLVGYSTNPSEQGVFPIGSPNRETNSENSNHQFVDVYNKTLRKECPTLTDPCHNSIRIKVKSATSDGYEQAEAGDSINLSNPNSETRRGRVGKKKAQTLETSCNQAVIEGFRIRKLTPIECERLQGFPDQHTAYGNYDGEVKTMSNNQRYKQCGNAVTVDVVAAVAKKCIPLFN
jgi:DNA (cytosine-5)-methyltransferase 1